MGRVSFEHIGNRARQLILLRHPYMADPHPWPFADVVADVDLGDYWCRLFPNHGLFIFLYSPSKVILHYGPDNKARVTPGFEDVLQEKVLPLLDRLMVLDDLAEVS